MESNNLLDLVIPLTNKGFDNLEDVLLIIFKYIEIIKKNGYEKKYFDDFIKLKKSEQIFGFNKNSLIKDNIGMFIEGIIRNYKTYGINQMFAYGTPNSEDYNEEKLKKYLNKLDYEKSFFGVSTIFKVADINSFLEEPKKKTMKYYNNKEYLLGKIPDEFRDKINDTNYDIKNLYIRDTNKYFIENFDSVIPCYKEKANRCIELKEFDYEKENKYKGTLLEENQNYITFYQIDKSSESYLVNLYLEISLVKPINKMLSLIIKIYFIDKLSVINELNIMKYDIKDDSIITLKFKSFTDNTKIIFEDLIKYLSEDITGEHFEFVKNKIKSDLYNSEMIDLNKYMLNLYSKFVKGEESKIDIEILIKYIDTITLEQFQEMYKKQVLNNIKTILFKIAGNIDEDLVKSLHKYLKETMHIEPQEPVLLQKPKLKAEENPYIINYYQKSEMIEEADNSILVTYSYEKKYWVVLLIFERCLIGPSKKILRFENSNTYSPKVFLNDNYFGIFEQGRYKEVFEMEDDINDFLYKVINGEIQCPGYFEIIQSFINDNQNIKKEKTPDNLFDKFIDVENFKSVSEDEMIKFPREFKELVNLVKPVFIQPKRITILVTRPEITDNDLKNIIQSRMENEKYKLNEKIKIEHTDNITYFSNRNTTRN